MINRAPQIVRLSVDLHIGLVKVPAPVPTAPHRVHTLAANVGSEQWAKAIPPEPHGLVTKFNSALEKQILHIPQ